MVSETHEASTISHGQISNRITSGKSQSFSQKKIFSLKSQIKSQIFWLKSQISCLKSRIKSQIAKMCHLKLGQTTIATQIK